MEDGTMRFLKAAARMKKRIQSEKTRGLPALSDLSRRGGDANELESVSMMAGSLEMLDDNFNGTVDRL